MIRKTLLAALLALALAMPAAAHAYLPEGFVGLSPQSLGNKGDFELMRKAGVTNVRLPLNWASVQSQSPLVRESDWTAFDREVELASEAGIRLMPFVFGTPDWVGTQRITLPVNSAWQRWAWANFIRTSVHRYGPDGVFWEENPGLEEMPIRRWEIWNEENIVTFAEPTDPGSYTKVLRIAGRVLHREDPGSKVLVGGFFGRPLQIPPNVASGDFLSRIYRAGNIKSYFDGVALHPYVAKVRAVGTQIANLRRIMDLNGDRRTPIYLTELGWGSQNGPTRWERGLYGQANQLAEALEMISAQRLTWRIGGVWWFTWTDEKGGCQFCRSAGLLTENREAKPAWYRFIAWTGGDPEAVPRAQLEG